MQSPFSKNSMVIAPVLVAIGIMCALFAYSPTSIEAFCAATGLAGTTSGSRPIGEGLQTDHHGGLRHQCRARTTVALRTGSGRRNRASWRTKARVLYGRESQQPIDRRSRHFQRHSAAQRHLFRQDPDVLLQQRTARPPRNRPSRRRLLCRPGIRQRRRHGRHRPTDVGLHLSAPSTCRTPRTFHAFSPAIRRTRGRQGAVRRAMHRMPRARHQQIRSQAGQRIRTASRHSGRLRLFPGAQKLQPYVDGRQSGSLADRPEKIHHRSQNAGSGSRPDHAPEYRCLSPTGERAASCAQKPAPLRMAPDTRRPSSHCFHSFAPCRPGTWRARTARSSNPAPRS